MRTRRSRLSTVRLITWHIQCFDDTMLMRTLLILLCCATLSCQEPLSTGMNEAQQNLNQILLGVSQGKLRALKNTPIEHFTQNIGRLDKLDQSIIRYRQHDIKELIERLDADKKALALQVLDERCREFLDIHTEPRGLIHFLPAPSAKKQLQEYADYFFDHGEMFFFLQLASLLNLSDKRVEVAKELVGNNFKIYKPGLVEPESAPLVDPQRGQDIEWIIHHNFIHACDPWHTVLWQRALGKYVEIQTGPEHILIKDERGFSIIDKNGYIESLANIPQAQSISINRHRAWFKIGTQVFGYNLRSKTIDSIKLPSAPLCAPIDDGIKSLWLCENSLVHASPEKTFTIRHQLSVSDKWSISHNGKYIYLTNGESEFYRVSPHNTLTNPTLHLCLEQSFDAAWQQCKNKNNYKDQWLKADSTFIKTNLAELLALDYTAEEQLLLHHRIHQGGDYPKDMIRLVRSVIAGNPGFELPMGKHDYLRGKTLNRPHKDLMKKPGWKQINYNNYNHKLSVHGLATMITHPKPLEIPNNYQIGNPIDNMPFVGSQTIEFKEHLTDSNKFAAQLQENGDIIVTCHDRHDRMFWQHRINKTGYHPSLSLGIESHYLILSVGTQHCFIFNKFNGFMINKGLIPGPFNDPKFIRLNTDNSISSIGPTGINNTLLIYKNIKGKGVKEFIPLNRSMRWHLPIGKFIMCSNGKQAFMYPRLVQINLPQTLIEAKRVSLHTLGIQVDNAIYPWK